MAKKIAVSTLNASTLDILNTIRQNASYEYQSLVPEVKTAHDIPAVGQILYGYQALANQFLNALINRIALVQVKSSLYNNPYARLKKGYLEFGETVEEVFVEIAKAREFSAEKAASRELKRTLPDVRSAFHTMNWRVQYPITIQDEDLRMAFLSMSGVQDLIAKIIDAVYTGAEYDEYLLFKYLMIKAISHGMMKAVSIGDGTDMKDAAVAFRATSNDLTFLKTKYNMDGVHTMTEKKNQIIFMDSTYNAKYDVNVLASAFNMDKADFMGSLFLIDDWTSFDNERFDIIRKANDMIEEVTDEELALLANVKAVIVDEEWFQVYDNQTKFTEVYVSSGEYWNYNLNVWKTVSSSPFSNAVVFVTSSASIGAPNSLVYTVSDISGDKHNDVVTFTLKDGGGVVTGADGKFLQNEALTTNGIAVHPYGAFIVPKKSTPLTFQPEVKIPIGDTKYLLASAVGIADISVGTELTLAKET